VVIAGPERENKAEDEDDSGELGLAEGAGDTAEAPADLGFPGEGFVGKEMAEGERERVLAHLVLVRGDDAADDEKNGDALDGGDACVVLLDEQLADHVGDERVHESAEESENEEGARLGGVVSPAGAEDEEGDGEIHQRGTPVAEILDEDGKAEGKKSGFGEVDRRERSDFPEVIDWDKKKDRQVDVEEGFGGGIAEEGDDADQSRDEDNNRHTAAGCFACSIGSAKCRG